MQTTCTAVRWVHTGKVVEKPSRSHCSYSQEELSRFVKTSHSPNSMWYREKLFNVELQLQSRNVVPSLMKKFQLSRNDNFHRCKCCGRKIHEHASRASFAPHVVAKTTKTVSLHEDRRNDAVNENLSSNARFTARLVDAMLAEMEVDEPCRYPKIVHDAFLDPRLESLAVFDAFRKEADRYPLRNLEFDGRRVPIVVNCGASGAGKTTQLALLAKHFEETTPGKAIYMTLNGNNANMVAFDEDFPTEVRLAQRLIHAAVGGSLMNTLKRIRRRLGHAFNSPDDNLEWEKFLAEPHVVVSALRAALGMKRSAPLLLLVDELRKFGDEPPIGEKSKEAVLGLRSLAKFSQQSFEAAAKDPSLGVTYVAASALAAVDPSKGITEGSNRPVFFMPLPPIQLKPFDEWVGAQRQSSKVIGRTLLWMCQGNARELNNMMATLRCEEEWSLEFLKAQLSIVEDITAFDMDHVLRVCQNKQRQPLDFISNIFWPVASVGSSRRGRFSDRMNIALDFEAGGMCAIIRNERHDSVYVHPAAAKALCEKLQGEANSHPHLIRCVLKLTNLLFKVPKPPGTPGCGKLYEQTMCLLMVSRVMSAFVGKVKLSELLPRYDPRAKALFEQDVKTRCEEIPEKNVRAFPRAAKPPSKGGSWSQVECSPMPKVDGPWFCCESLDEYNLLGDAMVVLELANEFEGKKKICLCLQMKEHSDTRNRKTVQQFRHSGHRTLHMNWNKDQTQRRVQSFAENHHIVHVLVTPNIPDVEMQKGKEGTWEQFVVNGPPTHTCVEALLTHDDIRQFCPMVAYSGCDARVLEQTRNQQSLKTST